MPIIKIIKERKLSEIIFYVCYMLKIRLKALKRAKPKGIQLYFKDKQGLEIGGPSKIFSRRGNVPVYNIAKTIDNVNFSNKTVWTGKIKVQDGYKIAGKNLGQLFIMDATNLSSIKPASYDFVISSHNLEHIANPLKALQQFFKVLKPLGILLIVVPRKESNFDHRRQITKFDQLLKNFEMNVGEDDLSNLEEILNLHDLRLDLSAGNKQSFKRRSLKNKENRCLHQHVYDQKVLSKMMKFSKFKVLKSYTNYDENIIIGQKVTNI